MALEKRGRDRLSIIATVLDVTKEGALKTQVMYRANLSYAQLNQYLSFLLEADLIDKIERNGQVSYIINKRGLRYLDNFQKIRDLVHRRSQENSYRAEKTVKKIQLNISYLRRAIDRLETSLAFADECRFCGENVFPDFKFCPYCGKTLLPKTNVQVLERKHT